uniref:Sulfotransferase n=1 Tax=Ficedula albicollis TaxID=59894 RepID=A0A803VE76_FICAL
MENSRKAFTDFVDKAVAAASLLNRDELMFSYKGILYPITICSAEAFKALESFEARSDDVILAAYPKSGTNWLRRILIDLIAISQKKTPGEEGSGNAEKPEEIPYLEVGDPEKYERMTKLPSPRFMATHLYPENLPTSIFRNKVKILLLIRNPKDVATSFFHFSNGVAIFPSYETWDDFFTDFMSKKVAWGSYFDHLAEWNKYIDNERIITISYEELKEDPILGMKKIASFFGFSLCEEDFSRIAKNTTFKAMKEKSSETHGKFGDVLFRKGVVGNWRDVFSEAQNEEMYRKFQDSLGGTKMAAKIKYDVYCKA